MPENLIEKLPEVFVSTTEISQVVSRAARRGDLRKIGSKLYTKNLTDGPEQIVKRNVWQLVAAYVPGALIADRTAIENVPAPDGSVFVIADRKRDIKLPGITIKPRKGHPPLEDDRPFIGGLFLSSMPRAFLENMMPSRARSNDVSRTLNRKEMENQLDLVLRRGGPAALNTLRERARAIAGVLDQQENFEKLDRLIGALLGTRTDRLVTPAGRARRSGAPYDPDRLQLFDTLHAELRSWPPTERPIPERTAEARATLAFFEAYFSNFIEGTEFAVSEAADIVFRGVIPRERPEDAHDVLGTWRLVSDPGEMQRLPADAEQLVRLLGNRHATIMAGRPDKRPGEFKTEANRAGQTLFVAPELVRGTLIQGYDYYRSLESAFARAVFMMFLVSEVHPFSDGNGRLARMMMNAELVAGGQERILIPTVYRNNYLAALKALSLNKRAEALIRALDFAQTWTAAVPWTALEETTTVLDTCNAFAEPGYADNVGLRLTLPQ